MPTAGLIAISILALTATSAAQTFKLDSNIVVVGVSVTDRYNHPVLGLEQDRFEIQQDHVVQPLAFFGREEAPLSVGMILDVSGSVRSQLAKVRDALAEFCKETNPEDEFFLITVSSKSELRQPFTNNCGDLQGKLFMIPAGGSTSLLDGVALGLQQLKGAHNPHRALVVVTDGQDNNSRYTEAQLKDMALESDAQIYVMGLSSNYSSVLLPWELEGGPFFEYLAAITGGNYFPINRAREIPEAANRIGEELHNQYVLGYKASDVPLDGKFHRILVRLLPRAGAPKMFANYKSGYYAPLQ